MLWFGDNRRENDVMKKLIIVMVMCLAMAPSVVGAASGSVAVRDCVDVEFVYARGSGQSVNDSAE